RRRGRHRSPQDHGADAPRRRRAGLMGLSNPGPAWLFCPADRHERYEKAAVAADVVILGLGGGCGAADRPAAPKSLLDVPLDPSRTVVRIDQFGTEDQKLDLQ